MFTHFMMSDFVTAITPILVSMASASIVAAIPVAMVWLNQHLALSKNAILNALISGAANRGASLALTKLGVDQVKTGVDYINKSFPDAVAQVGVTQEHLGRMVQAEINKQSVQKTV